VIIDDTTAGAVLLRPGDELCGGCGQSIDPTTCGCGGYPDDSEHGSGGVDAYTHPFIPMGCDCFRSRGPGIGAISLPSRPRQTPAVVDPEQWRGTDTGFVDDDLPF
jgi:hypothetical protein